MMIPHNFNCRLGRWVVLAILAINFAIEGTPSHGQPSAILRLRPDGPIARIHALEFSSDGKQLYAAGDEKQIQVWRVNDGRFERAHAESLRHSIGPGPLGSIHAMSVSDDQRYVVAGGIGTFKDHADFSSGGVMVPSVGWSEQTLSQLGTVSLFDTTNKTLQRIKTHQGYVLAATIISTQRLVAPYLVTIGNDQKPTDCGDPERETKVDRSIRVVRIPDGEVLYQWSIPETKVQPTLNVWAIQNATDETGLRIAVSLYNGGNRDGVDLFVPGVPQPKHIDEPYALTVDRIGQRDEILVSSRQGVRIIDAESGQQKTRLNLSQQLRSSEAIYSIRSVRDQPSLAAVTTRDVSQRNSPFRLRLLNVTRGDMSSAGIDLGNRQNSVMAADPTGKFIAATADVAQGIQIFSVAELERENFQPEQVLKPDFQPISRAALITVGDTKILKIQTSGAQGQNQTYQFSENSLRPAEPSDWRSTGQQMRFQRTGNENEFVASSVGGQPSELKIQTSSPPLGKQINSKLLGGQPLAAIASMQFENESQVQLSLYDPTTGIELRRLNGHQQFITGIEFSEDHEHLTSVSSDGMVCVWSLADLDQLIGKRSTIRGVDWCLENGYPTVSNIDQRHAQDSLKVGDQVIGIVDSEDNERTVEFESFEQFFRSLADIAPDGVPRLLVERDQKRWRVSVRLEQGTDERKPLFSFITLPNAQANVFDWLVWTPSGPFQSSGQPIEERAGWHFNPDDENPNARFAPLAQYRDDFYGEDLVDSLVTLGGIPSVWPPELEPEVSASLIDVDGEYVFADARLFQPTKPIVELQVFVAGVPATSVSQVLVRLDDGEPLEIMRSTFDPEIWQYELSEPLPLENPHDIDVSVMSKRIPGGSTELTWDVAAIERPIVEPEPEVEPEPKPEPVELPEIRITSHASFSELQAADLGSNMQISLEAIVDADQIPDGVKIVGVNNEKEVDLTSVQRDANGVKASIPLLFGTNRLALRLKRGISSVTSTPIMIDLIDPPIIDWIAGRAEEKNVGRVQLGVRSSRKPTKNNLQLSIAGVRRRQYKVSVEEPSPARPNLFPVILTGIPLSQGRNRIEVQLLDVTGDVTSRKGLVLLGKEQPKQPKLSLFLSDGAVFESSELGFTIAVTSDDLKEVTWHVGDKQESIAIQPDQKGRQLIDLNIPLQVGVNSLVLTAVSNAGLTTTESRSITRLQPPVELTVQHFTAENNKAIPLQVGDDSRYTSSIPVPVARGSLRGKVQISESMRDEQISSQRIRVWVNGFLQSIVDLEPTNEPGELRFEIPVMLSLPENEVRLDLPGLVEGEDTAVDLSLLCADPSTDQTLHLLILSTRVEGKQQREYEKNVVNLLGIANGRMPAFNRVISGSPHYPALASKQVRSDSLRWLIQNCRFLLASEQARNNAVLIYFQGVELVNRDGQFCLMTSDATPDDAFTGKGLITSTYLGDQFRGMKCANLLFLDVTPHPQSAPLEGNRDPAQDHFGVLRLSHSQAGGGPAGLSLLSQLNKVIPRVGELGQVTAELQKQTKDAQGLAFTESILPPIRRMKFGAQVGN